jgi:hypothetical protein
MGQSGRCPGKSHKGVYLAKLLLVVLVSVSLSSHSYLFLLFFQVKEDVARADDRIRALMVFLQLLQIPRILLKLFET